MVVLNEENEGVLTFPAAVGFLEEGYVMHRFGSSYPVFSLEPKAEKTHYLRKFWQPGKDFSRTDVYQQSNTSYIAPEKMSVEGENRFAVFFSLEEQNCRDWVIEPFDTFWSRHVKAFQVYEEEQQKAMNFSRDKYVKRSLETLEALVDRPNINQELLQERIKMTKDLLLTNSAFNYQYHSEIYTGDLYLENEENDVSCLEHLKEYLMGKRKSTTSILLRRSS